MRQVVSYKRLKTMKMLKLSPQCKEWSQSTAYERPGARCVCVVMGGGRGGVGGGTWVNFAGYVPLASHSPYPITMPRRLCLQGNTIPIPAIQYNNKKLN